MKTEPTTTRTGRTANLGDVVVTAFDMAAEYTTDPREASRLATQVVKHMLRRVGPFDAPFYAREADWCWWSTGRSWPGA